MNIYGCSPGYLNQLHVIKYKSINKERTFLNKWVNKESQLSLTKNEQNTVNKQARRFN